MKIKIALCDDDVKALPVIAGAAESAFTERGIATEIHRFTTGEALLRAMEQTHFQIILLDIEMPGMDGISVGKKIRERGDGTQIVYVSEAESRVFESFLVQPLGFVRKSNFLNDIAAVVELYVKSCAQDENAVYTKDDIIRASAAELASCDMALVGISSPLTESSQSEDGTWLPASLQFEAYTAKTARQESIGGFITTETMNDGYGTVSQDVKENRSYYNQSVGRASNYSEYELLQFVADTVPGSCKVVLLVEGKNPMVFSEVEPLSDAIILYWGQGMSSGWFKTDVLMSIVAGETEPSGLLNMQMPANMETVEAQYEDVPRDMECYVDADGNAYDFTFGLNWSGKIDDERVKTYNVPALTECENLDFYYAN